MRASDAWLGAFVLFFCGAIFWLWRFVQTWPPDDETWPPDDEEDSEPQRDSGFIRTNFDRVFLRTLPNGRAVEVQARRGRSYDWIRIRDVASGKVLFDKPSPACYDLEFCEPVDLEAQIQWALVKYATYLESWARKDAQAAGKVKL